MPWGQRAALGRRPGLEVILRPSRSESTLSPAPALSCAGPQCQSPGLPAPPAGLAPTGRHMHRWLVMHSQVILNSSDVTGSQWEAGLFPGLTA